MTHNNKQTALWLIGLISFGILMRLIPHPPNFSPIMAIALFAGARFGLKNALVASLLAMAISDCIIGIYALPVMLSVYGCIALGGIIGGMLLRQGAHGSKFLPKFLPTVLANAFLFYLVTNWAVWFFGGLYPATLGGLAQCYTLALPFLRNSVLGDLVFTGALFALYETVKNLKTLKTPAAI